MDNDSLALLVTLGLLFNSAICGLWLYHGLLVRWPGRGTPHLARLALVMVMVLLIIWIAEGYVDLTWPAIMPFYRLPEILGYAVADKAQQLGLPATRDTYRANCLFVGQLKFAAEAYIALALTLWARHLRYRLMASRKPPH